MRIQEQDLSVPVGAFDEIAAEYYDPSRHPTCANFRFASSLLLAEWLKDYRDETLCEVGCGKSLAAEILFRHDSFLPRIMLTDDSAIMLEYSRPWGAQGAQLKVASADALPIRSGSVQYLISSLGDPYNSRTFWQEAARVLGPNGRVLYTTPANDWSEAFRRGAAADEAEFELADGRHVTIHSCIYPEAGQIQLIEEAGLRVKEVSNVTVKDLIGQPLSAKLLACRGQEAGVVTGFSAIKP
jgi:SAM-dependent methyltransferase